MVKTDGNEKVDLFVNGTAAIRLDKNSEIRFDQIAGLSAPVGSSGSIRINLKAGTIDGSAKKVANGDSCDIAIPTGTVSTGGADFEVSVVETSAGVFEPAFFGCLNGSMQVELAANGGLPVTKVIAAQQIWNPIVVLDPVLVATSDLPMSLIQARKEIDQLQLTIHRSSNPSVNPPSFDITAPIGPVPGEFMLLPQPTQPRTFGYPPPPPLPVSPPILGQ